MSEPVDQKNPQPPVTRQCTAHTSRGTRCRRPAMHGTTVCQSHGGRAPQVRAKALQNVLEARINGELARMEITPVDSPAETIKHVVGEEVAFLDLARAKLAEVTDSWVHLNPVGGTEDTRAAIEVYERALDRAERGLSKLVQLGIEDRIAAASEMKAAAWMAALARLVELARTTNTDPGILIAQVITEEDE